MEEPEMDRIQNKLQAADVGFLATSGQVQALKDLVFLLARSHGLDTVDDVPLEDWLQQQAKAHEDRLLRDIENKNPAKAAGLQAHFDKLRAETAEG
jgi:hypothetical protein